MLFIGCPFNVSTLDAFGQKINMLEIRSTIREKQMNTHGVIEVSGVAGIGLGLGVLFFSVCTEHFNLGNLCRLILNQVGFFGGAVGS